MAPYGCGCAEKLFVPAANRRRHAKFTYHMQLLHGYICEYANPLRKISLHATQHPLMDVGSQDCARQIPKDEGGVPYRSWFSSGRMPAFPSLEANTHANFQFSRF